MCQWHLIKTYTTPKLQHFPLPAVHQGAAGCVYLSMLYLLGNAEFSLQSAPEVLWAAQGVADTVC